MQRRYSRLQKRKRILIRKRELHPDPIVIADTSEAARRCRPIDIPGKQGDDLPFAVHVFDMNAANPFASQLPNPVGRITQSGVYRIADVIIASNFRPADLFHKLSPFGSTEQKLIMHIFKSDRDPVSLRNIRCTPGHRHCVCIYFIVLTVGLISPRYDEQHAPTHMNQRLSGDFEQCDSLFLQLRIGRAKARPK